MGIALFCLRLSTPCIDHYHGLSPMASYLALSGLGAFFNLIKNKRILTLCASSSLKTAAPSNKQIHVAY
jgi:hypothetical protein